MTDGLPDRADRNAKGLFIVSLRGVYWYAFSWVLIIGYDKSEGEINGKNRFLR